MTIQPLVGVKSGNFGEYVLLKNSQYSTDKLSYLEWKFNNIFYLGANTQIKYKNFFFESGFTYSLPKLAGTMQDSDWVNIQYSNMQDYLYKTHYSESDNHLNRDYSLKFKSGYNIKLNQLFEITPYTAFDYSYTAFIAKGAQLWYGNHGSSYYYAYNDKQNSTTAILTGDVCKYINQTYFFWLGIDTLLNITNYLNVNLSLQTAPLVCALCQDIHIATENKYKDYAMGYFCAYKINFGATCKINRTNSFNLNLSYLNLSKITGNSYIKSSSSNKYLLSRLTQNGTSEKVTDVTLSWKVIFDFKFF